MNWADRYHPPSETYWVGRPDLPDSSCFFQLVKLLNLNTTLRPKKEKAFALIGFQCDEGIRRNHGRVGAAEGPNAIRSALAKLPLNRSDVVCYDAGDITCTDQDLEAAQSALAHTIFLLLKNNITPIIMGGGHEVAWGHYQGLIKYKAKGKLGIINFDAHFDMRPLLAQNKGTSGTPFLQIAQTKDRFDYNCVGIQSASNIPLLFETAKKYKVRYLLAEEVHLSPAKKILNFVDRIIRANQTIYFSLCLDVLAASVAPGVSAPQTLGLTPWQIIPALRRLAASAKVVSYDIAELSPPYDKDQRTVKLAAAFIYEIIHSHRFRVVKT